MWKKTLPIEKPLFALMIANPITLPFTAIWLTANALAWLIAKIPLIMRFFWFVTVKTCVLANNNGRLASFAGASLGALIGTIFGCIVVAMIAGAIICGGSSYLGAFFPRSYVALLKSQIVRPAE